MPRPNEYSRARFITMQVVMWGVLACAVGFAALSSRIKRGAVSVKLGEPQLLDSVTVRLPKGWKIIDSGDSIRAEERSADQLSRRTLIVRERDPEDMSLLERWMQNSTSAPAETRAEKRAGKNKSIKMGPTTGVLTTNRREYDRSPISELTYTATSTLPNKHVLTIAVICYDYDGANEEAAMEALKLVAESVEYVPAKELNDEKK